MTSAAEIEARSDSGSGKQQRIAFFDRADVVAHVFGASLVSASIDVSDEVSSLYYSSLAGRLTTRVLLNQGPGGYSLVESTVSPGTRVPRHSHNVPQTVLILEGSMRQGRRELGPGAGYFTPADTGYTFVAGPDGCRYVEFRQAAVETVTTDVLERNPARFAHEA